MQAYQYLREELKTFQGKPIKVGNAAGCSRGPRPAWASPACCSPSQARIKAKAIAINTFMPKNGYRPVEVNPYAQQRYTSYYIPPVYSPQQQFPLYSLIAPQAWSATHSFIDPALVRTSSPPPSLPSHKNSCFGRVLLAPPLNPFVPSGGAVPQQPVHQRVHVTRLQASHLPPHCQALLPQEQVPGSTELRPRLQL